jgi:hypothetical protein
MDFAEAVRPEQGFESGGVKVRQVWRGEAALPEAVERAVKTETAQEAGEPKEHAPAAREDENEVASG